MVLSFAGCFSDVHATWHCNVHAMQHDHLDIARYSARHFKMFTHEINDLQYFSITRPDDLPPPANVLTVLHLKHLKQSW